MNSVTFITGTMHDVNPFDMEIINPITDYVAPVDTTPMYSTNLYIHTLNLYLAVMNASNNLNVDPDTTIESMDCLEQIKRCTTDYIINPNDSIDYAFVTTFSEFPPNVIKVLIYSYKNIPDGLILEETYFDSAKNSEQHFYDYYGMLYPQCVLNLLIKASLSLTSEVKVEEYDGDVEPDSNDESEY